MAEGGRVSSQLPSVLVLGGGPDAERPVSLQSAAAVADALGAAGAAVHAVTIERPTPEELGSMPGDVVFPVLHGAFGEGGPLQDLLESDGRPYVGCGPRAARMAMDKVATKLTAARIGITTPLAAVLNPADPVCPLPLPVVLKPVHEGSSVGLHLCTDADQWDIAWRAASDDVRRQPARSYMIEALTRGRELTVGLVDKGAGLASLPLIEICAASGVYDYEAKYERDDTRYVLDPELPSGVADRCRAAAIALAREIGVRDLCRVDFLLDGEGTAWLLELNTMPGFTSHSLLPMAAGAAGMEMAELCAMLVSGAAARSDALPAR